MHPSPRSLHATPSQPPCAHPPVWPQLPDPQRRQWHEWLTQLLAQVIHGESIQERRHAHQDESPPSATCRLRL